jgi:hypothetical protein
LSNSFSLSGFCFQCIANNERILENYPFPFIVIGPHNLQVWDFYVENYYILYWISLFFILIGWKSGSCELWTIHIWQEGKLAPFLSIKAASWFLSMIVLQFLYLRGWNSRIQILFFSSIKCLLHFLSLLLVNF